MTQILIYYKYNFVIGYRGHLLLKPIDSEF